MHSTIGFLVKSLFNKDSISECSTAELQELVHQHPYFSLAQLLLTKKLKEENNPEYEAQLQKASLYFNDPRWLDHLLNQTGGSAIIPSNNSEKVMALEKDVKQVKQNDDLVFEPFHTVDYFASQGIKFKEDERPKDKFGQQLKSFTEWLKTMKRLPVQEIVKNADTNADQKVEQLAEHSIEDREVITEAMADVWEKQGNMVKAIEVYTKLSLLNPSKSAYFAARIREIKEN